MPRPEFSQEFTFEAVKLVRERRVSAPQAAILCSPRDVGLERPHAQIIEHTAAV